MNITQAPEFAEHVKQQVHAMHHAKQRVLGPDLHVSELLSPRKAYWTRKLGERASDQMLGYFITGEAFHHVIQKALGVDLSEQQFRLPGIVGTADFAGAYLCEIKTSRKYTIPSEADPLYVEQTKCYMAMSGRLEAYILVIYFVAGRSWDGKKPSSLEIVAWKMTATQEDLEKTKEDLEYAHGLLSDALTYNNPLHVPLCEAWKCGKEYKGQIDNVCQYYEECQPEGRYPLELLIPGKVTKKKGTDAALSGSDAQATARPEDQGFILVGRP